MALRQMIPLGLLVVTVLVGIVKGSDLAFTTSSTAFQPPVTKNLTLRCSLTDSTPPSGAIVGRDLTHTDDDVQYVNTIIVTRNGQDIASISEHVPAQVFGNIPHLQVNGQISSNQAEKGYIELHWQYPKSQDAGTYRCDVTGVNTKGHSFAYFSTVEITETRERYTGGPCNSTTHCAGDLQCLNGVCGCPVGHKLVTDDKCTPGLTKAPVSPSNAERYTGGPCNSTTHCAGDLQCLNGVCGCPNGHYLVNNEKCVLELTPGASCQTTDQCTGVFPCVNGTCTCPEGFKKKSTDMCSKVNNNRAQEFIYYGKSGVITSLGWPNNYVNYLSYRYVIQAEPGHVVNITFTSVDLENIADFVAVYDGRDEFSPRIVRITGNGGTKNVNVGKVFRSSSNVLLAVFYTDRSAQYKGFSATFNTST